MNKQIIPFCVDAKEENLTEEQIRQLHAWCLEVGADLDESADDWLGMLKIITIWGSTKWVQLFHTSVTIILMRM